jgi:hypothetical protein
VGNGVRGKRCQGETVSGGNGVRGETVSGTLSILRLLEGKEYLTPFL